MTKRILILGGIREASQLATKLVDQGNDVTTSLAGRTREPIPVSGKTRIGGFGGVDGMVRYLKENSIELLIDCTHPFATKISENARHAAAATDTPLEVHRRPPWSKQDDDQWTMVGTLDQACETVPAGSRVLLALGSQHISQFEKRNDVFFLVRMVDEPSTPLPFSNHHLLIGKPSTDWLDEKQLLEEFEIDHIICRNSGGTGAYAKIKAARELGLNVIMIERSST